MADSAGIVQNSVIDRGDGYAVTITNVAGNSLTLSAPLTQPLVGDVTQYTSLAGANYSPQGQLARFNITRTGGNYSAAIVASGHLSLSFFTESTNLMVYPFATSRPIKPELAFDNFDMSSMPPNQHIFGWPVLNSLEFSLR